jgi:hypothetical protein
MPYKKYIKRGGKVYGPYIYHSKRVDGKVVSEYHGAHNIKIDYKKFLWIGLGILIIALLTLGVLFLGNRISGKATFDVNVDYKEGEALDGTLRLSLKEGELLPASSMVVFENNGERYEYLLESLVSSDLVEGDFYVEGKSITGSGAGYGISGTKELYPTVYFALEVFTSEKTKDKEKETEEVEENNEEEAENVEEVVESSEESGITGGAISFFFGWLGTGKVVMELQKEIDGQVSKDNPFTYTLSEGETVEIKSKSVRSSTEELNENVIDLEVDGTEVTVTTEYSKEEKGFGEEYLGEDTKTMNIDLSKLDLLLDKGDLTISLIYSEEELISLNTVLQEEEIQIKEKKNEEIEEKVEEVEEIPEPEVLVPSGIDLTEEEREILIQEFGSININTIREEVEGDRLKIGFQLRDYKIEHTYEYPQAEEELQSQIKADLSKWLKDIAATLSKKASPSQKVDIIEDSYVI